MPQQAEQTGGGPPSPPEHDRRIALSAPQLIGLQLFFQGLSFDAALQGEFTRFGYFQVF